MLPASYADAASAKQLAGFGEMSVVHDTLPEQIAQAEHEALFGRFGMIRMELGISSLRSEKSIDTIVRSASRIPSRHGSEGEMLAAAKQYWTDGICIYRNGQWYGAWYGAWYGTEYDAVMLPL